MPGPQDTASTCRSHRRSAERCQKGEAHHDRDVTAGSGYSRTAGTAQPPLTIWTALRTRRIRYMLWTISSLPLYKAFDTGLRSDPQALLSCPAGRTPNRIQPGTFAGNRIRRLHTRRPHVALRPHDPGDAQRGGLRSPAGHPGASRSGSSKTRSRFRPPPSEGRSAPPRRGAPSSSNSPTPCPASDD